MAQTMVQKYLILRGGVYHFRYALPRDIRQIFPCLPREIKRSLRTDSISEAIALVSEKLPFIQAIKNYHLKPEDRLNFVEALNFERPLYISKLASTINNKIRFSDAWSDFSNWKSWSDKQAKANQRLYENLILFIGDVYVDEITKQVLKDALISIQKLPRRNMSPYKEMTLKQVSRMRIPEEHRVSSKYVKDHLKLCQSLFGRYLRDELDKIEKSPTEGLIYSYQQNRFAALTDNHVQSLLVQLNGKPDWFKWLFRLALYTGARRTELIRLEKSDFKYCSLSMKHYFEINAGKTKAAQRQVPISTELETIGFIEWLEQLPVGRIFNVTANRATDLFNSLIEEKRNFYGERIVFHSLRHTFITKARASGISDVLVQQVVGHEKRGAGQTDRYTHHFDLADVLIVVESVSFTPKTMS